MNKHKINNKKKRYSAVAKVKKGTIDTNKKK